MHTMILSFSLVSSIPSNTAGRQASIMGSLKGWLIHGPRAGEGHRAHALVNNSTSTQGRGDPNEDRLGGAIPASGHQPASSWGLDLTLHTGSCLGSTWKSQSPNSLRRHFTTSQIPYWWFLSFHSPKYTPKAVWNSVFLKYSLAWNLTVKASWLIVKTTLAFGFH